MITPHLRADGRLQLTGDLAVDPDAVAIQQSWSETRTRWLGVLPRTRVWLHTELRAADTRVRVRSSIEGAPEGMAHQAARHEAELDADVVEALLARLRELGARDVRRVAGVTSVLAPDASNTGALPEGEPAQTSDDVPNDAPPNRVPEPMLQSADRERFGRELGPMFVLWSAALGALWLFGVRHFVALGATLAPLAVGLPATIILMGRLRASLGHTLVAPHAPTHGWLPQRFQTTRRRLPEEVGGFWLTPLPYWVVWFGFWLSLAQTYDAMSHAPLGLAIGVGAVMWLLPALDLRREWRTAMHAIGLLRDGRNGVMADETGPQARVDVDQRSRGSGKSRHTVYRIRETVTGPDAVCLWCDGEHVRFDTKGATWLSSAHVETDDGHAWHVPRGAKVRFRQVDGALVAFATCSDHPTRELWAGLVWLGLSTLGLTTVAVLAVFYAVSG